MPCLWSSFSVAIVTVVDDAEKPSKTLKKHLLFL